MAASTPLPPAVAHVLNRLPGPPQTFTAADVLDAPAAVLDVLTASEIVASRAGVLVVRPEARPF